MLVDAGAGTLLGPGVGGLLGHLRAAGFDPQQVAVVYVTDMHPDHVGGLVAERKPVFPSAIVRASGSTSSPCPAVDWAAEIATEVGRASLTAPRE